MTSRSCDGPTGQPGRQELGRSAAVTVRTVQPLATGAAVVLRAVGEGLGDGVRDRVGLGRAVVTTGVGVGDGVCISTGEGEGLVVGVTEGVVTVPELEHAARAAAIAAPASALLTWAA